MLWETHSYSSKETCSYFFKRSLKYLELARDHVQGVIKKSGDVTNRASDKKFLNMDLIFDKHTVKSLDYLIKSIKSGKEEQFKEHTKHWLRSNNYVDFCYGLIEEYDDPMNHIGTFQADITVKSEDLGPLMPLLKKDGTRISFSLRMEKNRERT